MVVEIERRAKEIEPPCYFFITEQRESKKRKKDYTSSNTKNTPAKTPNSLNNARTLEIFSPRVVKAST